MLSRNQDAQNRWGGNHQALDHWLEERQELLVRYCEMAGLPPYSKSESLPPAAEIQGFCQVLVDYVSTGHFEIYDKLIANAEVDVDKAKALAQRVYPLITATTEQVLSFNDAYADVNAKEPLPDFDSDLSKLGEALEVRMELEDNLLHMLEQQQALVS